MLPCAEDLGMIPQCSFRTLEDYSVPGMDVQRWMRAWDTTQDFKLPERYRKNSAAVISTHDMLPLCGWWECEASSSEKEKFWKYLGLDGKFEGKCTRSFVLQALERVSQSASIFSVQLFQDWLSLDETFRKNPFQSRINLPGTISDQNWRWTMPFSLEQLMKWPQNATIRELNQKTGRVS